MSFPRMQKSASMAQLGIPACVGMTRKGSFHTVSCARMTFLVNILPLRQSQPQ
ncbi:MAG: hypothetical protein NT007_12370 [Candidatus Kapabacteria bacterium]|nr:hypothetical protein [Candidatus Kapabacteria bacterium]